MKKDSRVTVYHGTHRSFLDDVKETGLVPPPGQGKGVRVRLTRTEALADAKAWSARMLFRFGSTPEGMIVVAKLPSAWITRPPGDETLRVAAILPTMLKIRGPYNFTEEFLDHEEGPLPPFFEALEAWEILTSRRLNVPLPRRHAGSPGSVR